MNSTNRKIAAVLAFIIGAMAIYAGGQVVLGKIMDYYVIDWLPAYNFAIGLISAAIAPIFIWKGSKFALPTAVGIFVSHSIVMLILQTAYRDVVAPDSTKAMTVRIVAWVVILTLMVAQERKSNKHQMNGKTE